MANKKVTPNKNSKFWIHPDDFQKVIDYAAASYDEFKSEIAGQMIVVPDAEGDFILKAPVIMKQTVSGGLCTLDKESLAKYYAGTAVKEGADVRFCWWHSHHTMGAFWSSTDDDTILSNPSKDWTVSLVVNLKKEYKLRIQFFEPFMHEENVELNLLTVDSDVDDTILNEVKDLCEKTVTTPVTYVKGKQLPLATNHSYGSYPYDDMWNPNTPANQYAPYYNSYFKETVYLSKVPKEIFAKIDDELISLTDECHLAKTDKQALSKWNSGKLALDKQLLLYNLRLRTFNTPKVFMDALLQFWPEDYYEEIHKTLIGYQNEETTFAY